jgi:two-component system cell cycle sensor histidine kinase/response regulator CckA
MEPRKPEQSARIVLVVGDDQPTLGFVTESVAKMGQKVLSATSGEEAMAIIAKHGATVDLLLSDVVMPGMNGIELAKAVTANAPETKIILMSGCMQPAIFFAHPAKYATGFIQKPFSGKTLKNHIKKALRELRQENSR